LNGSGFSDRIVPIVLSKRYSDFENLFAPIAPPYARLSLASEGRQVKKQENYCCKRIFTI
jgi:hypothetical protein